MPLKPLVVVELLLQRDRRGRLAFGDDLRKHHDAVVARFGKRRRFNIKRFGILLAERLQLGTWMQTRRERCSHDAVRLVSGELCESVVGIGFVIAENGSVVSDRSEDPARKPPDPAA